MIRINYTILIFASLFLSNLCNAQFEVFNIGSVPTYTSCDAIMHDSNGGLSPYSPNSLNTITICAAGPETQINLYFIGFLLSEGDSMTIYDGNSVAAPEIGVFGGDSLLFHTISSSNPSGCLTVVFVSNADALTGDFSAKIFCGIPCDFPIALIDTGGDTLKICPNEPIQFDGSASSWTSGVGLDSVIWDFGDATTGSTFPVATHSYSEPGGYRVRLYITDDNDCSSANIPETVVLVSTPYDFNLTSTSAIFCVNSQIYVGASGFIDDPNVTFEEEAQNGQGVNWTESQSVVFDNGIYIPDNQGCLETEITFNQFGTAVLNDSSDFASVFVNMEHSFVGDITISIICPNGQVMSIWPEAGGSGTFLGEPIDDESGVPGVGYDYSWSPTSTNGTWADAVNGGIGTIPEGDYEPEGDWADLFGCPLNGVWTLEVCDIVGADDGWVFEFGLTFAGYFYPDLLTFTPVTGNNCDSSYWENPDQFSFVGPDCDWAIFNPSVGGIYTFTYHVLNDFGCEYTDDIQLTVMDPEADAGDNVPYCGENVTLNGAVGNPLPGFTYAYSWTPTNLLNNPSISNSVIIDPIDSTTVFYLDIAPIGYPECISTDSVIVKLVMPPFSAPRDTLRFCAEAVPFEVLAADQTAGLSYSWNHIQFDTTIVVGMDNYLVQSLPGLYNVFISEPQCGFTNTQEFFIILDNCPILIPNIFTPNGDGDNDRFEVQGLLNFPGSTLQVFDRWGKIVLNDKDYGNSWQGGDVPDGTYFYILGIKRSNGMEYHSSHMTIVR